MNAFRSPIVCAALATATLAAAPAAAQLRIPRVSPKTTLTQTLGVSEITVVYSRPGVRGRTVWGDLVPYDQPWRTGANEATTFTCSDEIRVDGHRLPAGTYSLLTLPGRHEWTVVFSNQKELWGAFAYDSTKDQLRVRARPRPAEHQEWMEISFEDLSPASLARAPVMGNMVLRWEKLALPIAIEVDLAEPVLAGARAEMAKLKDDDWRTPLRAATFCFDYELNAEEAMRWAQKSAAIQENHANLSLLAKMHARAGKKKEAIALAQKAVKLGKASPEPVNTTATESLLAEWTGKKK